LEEEEEVYQSVVQSFGFEGYDWGAFAYFIYRAGRKKIFNDPLPSSSPWQDPKKYLCTEIYTKLPEWIAPNKLVGDLSITTPMTMFNILSEYHVSNQKALRIGEVQ